MSSEQWGPLLRRASWKPTLPLLYYIPVFVECDHYHIPGHSQSQSPSTLELEENSKYRVSTPLVLRGRKFSPQNVK